MAKGFNLTANLVLSGPQNIKPVVAQIRRQIGTINANVQLKFDPKANKNANILAQNVGKLSTSLNALTISANNSASAINGLSKAFSNFQRINSSTISTLNSTGKAVNKINVATQHAGDSFSKFGKEAALAVKRFAAYTIVTAGVFGFVNAIGKAVGEAIDFQHELVKIAQVSGKSTKQLTGLVDEVSRLSREWGVSSKQLINTAQILAQAGLSADDTRISLEALAKSTLAPTFKDIENTTEGAIAAMAQFKIKARDLESVLGSVNAVSAAFAVESEDLISVIRRAGGAFAAAGAGIGNFGSESERGVRQLQELSALFTSVRATTRESADSIATGLRTIFTRVQRGSTIEFLKQFNIQLAEGGKFVGQFEAFKRLSEGLKDLDTRDIRFSQIIEELGGFRQVSKVIPLLKNFAVAEEALGVAIGGQTSLTKDAISAQESIQVQITKTRERFLELIRDISQTNTFKAITQGVLSLANGFITLGTYLKPVIPLITTLFAIKGFQALRQFTSGFTGAFRGVTANQLGQNAGGVVAGTGGGTAAAATATLATSQSLLKNAILANTYAINQLTQIIGASRLGGGRSPKFGPGFARGGVVPGSGNTDSVPAMLMPGEFVIRKKAVEAMGTEKLHAMNKFAKGGKQKRKTIFQSGLSKNADAPTFGAIFMEPAGKIKSEQKIKIPGSSLGKGRKAVEANLVSASLSEQVYKNAVESIGEPVKAIIRSVALDISGGLSDINDIKNIPNINAIQGSIFEGAVASLGAPIGDVIDEQRAFDYPGGLKTASYLFDSRLTDAPTDAKRTYNRDALRSIRGKIIRSLSDAGKPKAEAEKAQAGFTSSELAILKATNKELSPTDVGRALNRKVSGEELKPFFVRRGKFKFASGGSVGTDSVPAMLTPGEFVLRKEAAQRIGRNNLDDLNNADKVQGFANGGGVARHGRMFYGPRKPPIRPKTRINALPPPPRQFPAIDNGLRFIDAPPAVRPGVFGDAKPITPGNLRSGKALEDSITAVTKSNQILKKSLEVQNRAILKGATAEEAKTKAVEFATKAEKSRVNNTVFNRAKRGIKGAFSLTSEEERKSLDPSALANLKENRRQTRLFALSGVASTASQFLPQNNQFGAATTSAVSGGSLGLGIGAAAGLGPLGLAAAATVGALDGLVKGITDFNDKKALEGLERASKAAETAMSEFADSASKENFKALKESAFDLSGKGENFRAGANDRGSFNGIFNAIARPVINAAGETAKLFAPADGSRDKLMEKRLNSFVQVGGSGILGDIFGGSSRDTLREKQADEFRSQAATENPVFKAVALEEAKRGGVSTDVLEGLAKTTPEFIKNVEKEAKRLKVSFYEQLKDSQSILDKITPKLKQRLEAEVALTKSSEELTTYLKDNALAFQTFADELSTSIARITAKSSAGLSGLSGIQSGGFSFASSRDFGENNRQLGRIDTLSVKQLDAVGNSLNVKGNAKASEAFETVRVFKDFDVKLRNSLSKINSSDFGETGDLEGKLRDLTGADGNSGTEQIIKNLAAELNSRQEQFKGNPEKIQEFFDQTFQQRLPETAKAAIEALKAFSLQTEEVQKTLAGFKDQRIAANRVALEAQLQAGDVRTGGALALAENTGGLPPSAALLNAGFNQQLQTLTGFGAGGNQIDLILSDFAKSSDALRKKQEEGLDITEEEITKHEKLTKAVQKITSDMTPFNTAIKKAGEAAEKQRAFGAFGQRVLQAGPEELNNLGVGFGVANQIQAGNLNAVNAGNIQQFQAALPEILDNIAKFQGQKAADDFQINALDAQFRADGKVTAVEKQFLAQIKAQQAERVAQEAIAKKAIDNQIRAADVQLDAAQKFAMAVEQFTRDRARELKNTILPLTSVNNASQNSPLPGTWGSTPVISGPGITTQPGESSNKPRNVPGAFQIQGMENFSAGINKFGESINQFASIKIPEKITVEVAPIQTIVTFNGEGVLADKVAQEVSKQVGMLVQQQIAGIVNPLNGQIKDGIA